MLPVTVCVGERFFGNERRIAIFSILVNKGGGSSFGAYVLAYEEVVERGEEKISECVVKRVYHARVVR